MYVCMVGWCTERRVTEVHPEGRSLNSVCVYVCNVTGLDEISAQLRTVDNYTRLLQADQRALNESLTESRVNALGLLQCKQMLVPVQDECRSTRQEVAGVGVTLDYLQVTSRDVT